MPGLCLEIHTILVPEGRSYLGAGRHFASLDNSAKSLIIGSSRLQAIKVQYTYTVYSLLPRLYVWVQLLNDLNSSYKYDSCEQMHPQGVLGICQVRMVVRQWGYQV